MIKSNNALELDDEKCKKVLWREGHCSSNKLYQQNGRAERKHRNVFEIARALRFQTGLPLSFLGDCAFPYSLKNDTL